MQVQMNGAELPCGTVLKVEPADASYQQPKTSQYGPVGNDEQQGNDNKQLQQGESIIIAAGPTKTEDNENEDEDLDDFFESLT